MSINPRSGGLSDGAENRDGRVTLPFLAKFSRRSSFSSANPVLSQIDSSEAPFNSSSSSIASSGRQVLQENRVKLNERRCRPKSFGDNRKKISKPEVSSISNEDLLTSKAASGLENICNELSETKPVEKVKKPKSKSKNQKQVLTRWFIRRAYTDANDIFVDGYRPKSNGNYVRWHSSVIKCRIDSRLLSTNSGNLYCLSGPPDEKAHWELPPGASIEQFRDGIPTNWEEIFSKWSRSVGKSLKKSMTKSSNKKTRSSGQITATTTSTSKATNNHALKKTKLPKSSKRSLKKQDKMASAKDGPIAVVKAKENHNREPETTLNGFAKSKVLLKKNCDHNKSPYDAEAFLNNLSKKELDKPVRLKTPENANVRRSRRLRSKGAIDYSEVSPAQADSEYDQLDDEELLNSDSETGTDGGVSVIKTNNTKQEKLREEIRGPKNGEWTAQENRLLREGHARADPTHSKFWSHVASFIPGRTAQQCYNQWFLNSTQVKSAIEFKRQRHGADPSSSHNQERENGRLHKLAGKNTAKFRGQVREVFRASEQGHTDDLFTATPFRNKFTRDHKILASHESSDEESIFDFDTSIATPNPRSKLSLNESQSNHPRRRGRPRKASTVTADADEPNKDIGDEESNELHIDSGSEVDDLQYIGEADRKKADRYIAGLAKRRKLVPRQHGTSQLMAQPVATISKGGVDTAVISDGGVRGSFTPGGSVRINVRAEDFAYEFSDDDEGFDNDDDDDDGNSDR